MDRFEQFKSKFPEFSNLSNGEIVNLVSQYTGADPQRVYSEFGGEQNRSAFGDLGTALKIGAQRLPETATGLADVLVAPITGRASVSEATDSLGRATGFRPGQWANDSQLNYSPAQQQFLQQGAQTEGFADTAAHYLTNPMRSVVQGVESVPGMALGGVYARGLRGLGGLGNAARFGAGEGGVMAGQAMNQMVEDGVDPARAAGYAAGVGALGGVMGGLGGRFTERLGGINPDQLLGGGGRTLLREGAEAPGLMRRVGVSALGEGVFEEMPQSAMEAAMGNLAAERPWDQDVGKQAAAGLVLGGLMGGVVGVVPPARNPADPIDLLNRDTTPQAPTAPAAGLNLTNLVVPQQGIFSEPSQVEQWAGIAPAPTAEQHASRAEDILAAFNTPVGEVGGRPVTAWEAFQREQGVPANRIQTGPAQLKEAAPKIDIPVPQPLQSDPVRSAVAQASPATLRKDGSLKDIVEKALGAYSEFSDGEIAAALEEFAASKRKDTVWRVAALEAIARQRAAQGAPNVAQVDAASGQGAGAVPAGSAGNTPSGPVVLDGVRQPTGAPAPSSAARVPVGEPVVQQPTGLTEGAQPANVPPTQQVAPQATEARGQERAQASAEQSRDAERAQVSRIFDTLSEREREVLTKYHFDKMTFEEIGSELKERGESGTTRQRIEQQHKDALKKLAEAGRPFGLTPERLRLYFPDESRRMAGGADIQTASAAEVAQAGAGMTYRNESNNGAVNQANDEFEVADAVDGAEALDLDTDIAREEFDEGFRGEQGAEVDALEQVEAVESMARTERDHKGIPLQPVDFEDAASDYDLMADEGDTPFAELPRQIQVQWVKAWVAAQDGALTDQQLVRVFSEIADQYVTKAQTVEPGAAATAQGVQENARGESQNPTETGEEVTGTVDSRRAGLGDGNRFSRTSDTQGTTVEAVRSAINDIATPMGRRKITVYQTADEAVQNGALNSKDAKGTQGWVDAKGNAYFIAGNIPNGSELAVVLHEIGAHLGIEKLLTDAQYEALVKKIFTWAQSDANTQEARIARAALARVDAAKLENEADLAPETLAYFIEEAVKAGVNPTAMQYKTELGRWFRTLWAAFKVALRRLNLINADRLTAQNVVDLAYGAANLELTGVLDATYAGGYAGGSSRLLRPEGLEGRGRRRASPNVSGKPELGASQKATPDDIMVYYANAKEKDDLFDDRQLDDTGIPGLEVVYWGDSSTFGPFSRILTHGGVEGDGRLGFYVTDAQSLQAAGEIGIVAEHSSFIDQTSLLHVMVTQARDKKNRVRDNVWEVGFQGPTQRSLVFERLEPNGVSVVPDPDPTSSDPYTRLEGIPKADVKDLLAEVRRRITRYQGGRVPNIVFTRETGAAVGKRGFVPSDVVAKRFSKAADPQLTELAQESGRRAWAAIRAGVRKGWTGLAFSSHLANAAHRAGLTSARALELVQRKKATRAYEIQIEVEKVLSKFADLKGQINGRPASEAVQRFIYDSTFDKKWGFAPDWKQDAVVDPEMERRFNALPTEAQAVIKDVFRHGDTIFREKQDLLRKTITGEYEALIKVETDDGKRRKLERQRDKELREAGRLIAEMNGPYAPLRRYGDYVVVAKSQKYRDAEAAGSVDAKLKRDENHYVVEFAETLYEAERLQGVLEGKFGKGLVWAGEKEAATEQFGELPFMAVQRLRKMVDTDLEGDLNTKSKRVLNKLLVDLYISTLHEANARHSEQKRQFVNRADRDTAAKDMMRAFATQGRADSHLVSALQFNSEIVDEMQKLRNEAKNGQGDSLLKTRLRNEILQRHMMDLDFRETPVQDKLMSLNSFWMLLTSPGYYVQNATQVMMMTQPVLAGRFGQNRSMRQLMRGYQDAMRVLKGSSWNEAADLSRFNGTADEKAMLIELQARGTLDFGISAELGYWESRGEISKVFNQVMRKVGMGTRKLEVLNRMSSALAAYRLMYDQTTGTQAKRHAAALDYADSIIKDTHGDYSSTNAPRYLRMMPKVMTQFRKFQLIQLSLFAKVIHGSIKGANPQEKRVMLATLGYLFMNHALLAGAVGIPASALLGAIYAIAGDDDDPNDWEVDVRRAIGDKEMADLILHGLPSLININMSNKIGAGTMLDPLPFVEYEATRGGYEKAVTAAMGPLIGGLGAQVVDAFGRILKGDVAQGTAQLLPRGFRDAARGFMAAQDGIRLRNGQTALTPEELSFYDSLMMGLGLPTLKTTSRTETQFKSQQYEQFFRERVTKIKRQYSEAYEDNDREAMLEARQAWAEMQASRKNLGFKGQPLSDLLKAPREKAKAEAKLQGGVRTTEQARGFVQSLQ